jgi:hypothetical protein
MRQGVVPTGPEFRARKIIHKWSVRQTSNREMLIYENQRTNWAEDFEI